VDNELARCSGDGVQINSGAGPDNKGTSHHIFVGRNVTHHHKQSGLWTKTASDVIFSQNVAYGLAPSDSSGGAAAGYQYGPERVWFLFNRFSDCWSGINGVSPYGPGYIGAGQDIFIIGNLFANIHDRSGAYDPNSPYANAAILTWDGRTRWIVNNTFYDVDAGIHSPDSGAHRLANNIMDGVTAGHQVLLSSSAGSAASTLSHELYAGPFAIRWGDRAYASFDQFRAATGQGAGALHGDPLFVDRGEGDFHLQSGSPAIDHGQAHAVYDLFQGLYGLSIALDADRQPRPSGAAWDMGLFEY
jgi:hypothetical protein